MSEDNNKIKKVKFNKEDGPIILEVFGGYCTLGSFILCYRKIGDHNLTEFGKDPKRIDDSIKDIFLIPIAENEISQYEIIIFGKYSPPPGHTQIKVKYEFIQKDKALEITPKGGNIIEDRTDEEFVRYSHHFRFPQ